MNAVSPRSAPEDRQGRVVTFYSYKGGTGRTMTMANVAWILAANGKKVLTVDWDLEAPGLSRFFHPFLNEEALATTGGVVNMVNDYLERSLDNPSDAAARLSGHAAVQQQAIKLNWNFPDGGRIDFISAGKQNNDYGSILDGLNWDQFYERYYGGVFLDALREEMVRSYDYAFIDSRTGLSDTSSICTQQLPDDVVVCFTLSDQSIRGAALVARHIQTRGVIGHSTDPIRILPVPMRIDEGEKDRAERGRAEARSKFEGLPKALYTVKDDQYWGSIEIPYKPYYAYEEILAVFGDQTGIPNTVLGACERLTRELTRGEVSALPPMAEPLRLATVAKFDRKPIGGGEDTRFHLWYAVEDQMWLDWTSYLLEAAGYRFAASRIDSDAPDEAKGAANGGSPDPLVTVPLLTVRFLQAARASEFWGPVSSSSLALTRPRTLGLRLGSVPPGAPSGHSFPLDLTSPALTPVVAAEQLIKYFGGDEAAVQAARTALDAPDAPRYPGIRPEFVALQSRNSDFTGRAKELAELRRTLTGRSAQEPTSGTQALHGLGGVGKSQLAREYAYRFMSDYDLVWWVPSEQTSSITTELAAIADRLGIRGTLGEADAAILVKDTLAAGTRIGRWLLIFDNAEDPETLTEFLPGGDGHVIITSRKQVWSQEASELEVDVFTRQESVSHLERRVPEMSDTEAAQLAEELGDLPLAVEQAAAFLRLSGMPVETYMDLLKQHPADIFDQAPLAADYPVPIRTTFAVSLNTLEKEWPSARRLMQMSVFLGPEPFSQKLLHRNPAMLTALAVQDPRVRKGGASVLGGISRAIRSLSLAKVDGRRGTIQVHRVLQALLRAQMTEDEREQIQREVQLVLAECRPLDGEVEDPENRPDFELIRPHLAACGAEESEISEVRQLMIDLVRLHWRNGDYTLAKSEGERLDALWCSTLGPEHPQTLALRTIRANVLRDQGRYRESLELDQRTWEQQSTLLGEDDLSTLATARGLAGGLRALGRYQEALDRDLLTHASLVEQFLEEDRQVLNLTHNLAIDYRLLGDAKSAQQYDERTERLRRQGLGPDHARTLASQLYLARDKRDGGELRDAAADLERLHEAFRRLQGDDSPDTLRAAKSLAVSLRVLGQYERAAALTDDTLARFVERYGEDGPDTLQCALNKAADDWSLGRPGDALRRAQDVWQRYRRLLGDDHPNSLACSDNVSVYLRTPGASRQDRRRAAGLGETATTRLTELLGASHPFTLCAEVNWANARAELEELAAAEASERSCLSRLALHLGEDHPDTLACRSNLAVTLKALGRTAEAQRLHDEAVEAFNHDRNFGETHPDTVSAEGWERINHILELQAW
ncbi:FxSxx-COOH system tetratricopeptide repeat protein [Streptacidiphilus sp. N1-10]|uniref:FxSxx-COOH system tetratricopeptide repeat protein n=1 Tax=Streptacidiphilus jeojiensis TaxID=3229225 RepID=A0ABV6XU90_9ACTN